MAETRYPVLYRTYSRLQDDGDREHWKDIVIRCVDAMVELGHLTKRDHQLMLKYMMDTKSLPSGRWCWVGGTDWLSKAENYSGAFNCTSTEIKTWGSFRDVADLAMQGSGTGAVLEKWCIKQLPPILNKIFVSVVGDFGTVPKDKRTPHTKLFIEPQNGQYSARIVVGDSRLGWCNAYMEFLKLASLKMTPLVYMEDIPVLIEVEIDVSNVRAKGEPLKGFGGTANPSKLRGLWSKLAKILNKANGRKLSSLECCMLIDEMAVTIVAGNIRRSAGIRQFAEDDILGGDAKKSLWKQDSKGVWVVDKDKDCLRLANHTRVFHHKPTLQTCIDSVRSQYYSGEGAIQFAPEAIARANCDMIDESERIEFINAYVREKGSDWLKLKNPNMDEQELQHRLHRYGLNPCGK